MFGTTYKMNAERLVAYAQGVDPEAMVPACPEWTISDVYRHLAGLASDVLAGNVTGYGGDGWTAAQVGARRDEPLSDVVGEWHSMIDQLVELFDSIDQSQLPDPIDSATGPVKRRHLPAAVVGDLMHHEFDVRHAAGDRTGRDRFDVVAMGVGHAKSLRPVFNTLGLPTLRIRVEEGDSIIDVGRDEPIATLTAPAFELLRAVGGRRTTSEIAELDWQGAKELFLPHMVVPPMTAAAHSLNE